MLVGEPESGQTKVLTFSAKNLLLNLTPKRSKASVFLGNISFTPLTTRRPCCASVTGTTVPLSLSNPSGLTYDIIHWVRYSIFHALNSVKSSLHRTTARMRSTPATRAPSSTSFALATHGARHKTSELGNRFYRGASTTYFLTSLCRPSTPPGTRARPSLPSDPATGTFPSLKRRGTVPWLYWDPFLTWYDTT